MRGLAVIVGCVLISSVVTVAAAAEREKDITGYAAYKLRASVSDYDFASWQRLWNPY